jgi:hypothetical protein
MILLPGEHCYRYWFQKTWAHTKNILSPFPQYIFQVVEYYYGSILEKLNLQTLHIRRRHSDALFLISVFNVAKFRAPLSSKQSAFVVLLGTNGRNFTKFTYSYSHCPSPRCVPAANAVCKCTNIFNNLCLSVKSLSCSIFFVFYCFFWCSFVVLASVFSFVVIL